MSNPIVGSTVRTRITVTDPDTGELTGATVSLTVQDPSGNETTPSPSNPSTGVYEYYLELDEVGWWNLQWQVTAGSYTTVTECQVCAAESVFT